LIARHHQYTGSMVAARVLDNWDDCLQQFVKVMPTDYKRVLEERKRKSTMAPQQAAAAV
jgi:glutamate synthase (NADPH) large chain